MLSKNTSEDRKVKQIMRLLTGWIKRERTFIIGMFIMSGLLAVCTYLYGESMRPLMLTLWMCGFFFLFWCMGSLLLYWHKYRALYKTQKELLYSLDSLPKAVDGIEMQYQDMLQELHQKCENLDRTLRERCSEEQDYYTLWVHQIKTPIAAMHLILQNMDDEIRSAQLSNELFRIEQYAGMALQYIRLQESGTDLNIRPCDVYQIVTQILRQYKTVFIEKKLSISFDTFSCIAVTDEKWFSFIVEQILSNAVKYTTKGGVSIQYREKNTEQDGKPIGTIIIQDTGIGIQKGDLPRVFERGFTGYNGHLNKRSTGIGLYLCKKTADMLGMVIQIDSELNRGTCVQISFHLTKMKEEQREM